MISRTKTTLCAVALGALVTTGCSVNSDSGSGAGGDRGNITYATWGGVFGEAQKTAWADPFAEESGIGVTMDEPQDLTRVKVQVESGNVEWDVFFAESFWTAGYCDVLFEKIDYSRYDTSEFAEGTYNDCGVPADTFSVLMVYNKEKYGDNPPTKLADFFDTKAFPGSRMIFDGPAQGMLEMALHADGVAPEDMYPIDYDRVFSQFDRIKGDMLTWTEGAESLEALTSGNADMALVWSGRAYEAALAGAPYAPVWDGNLYSVSHFAILKGTKNPEEAQEFAHWASGAEPQTAFSESMAYGPGNLKAEPEWDDTRREWEPSLDEHREQSIMRDDEWWAENEEEAIERWLEWVQQ